MVIDYQTKIRQVQDEQDRIRVEIRSVEQQQEEFFALQQEEQRLYSEVVETSPPEERQYFKSRGEDSFSLAKKAQRQLEEQEDELKNIRRQLIDKEELYIQQRKEQVKEKEQ
ncbi:hypothetical protein CI088_09115 [Enterococcus plantarum]|uniref:Uncharacterized protein n=1 Tax=Enterococcus plantarum TaxID=1077675 RepID=A0A2W3ZW46_9ENTE|nr:DUF3958 family protein [Enterococcus plantarum]PZL73023.1 hypothetical protein CI088_09115 [Enterococcus plantarum]